MTRPDPQAQTRAYERWLAEAIPVVSVDLERKHREMAGSIVRFVRGTYYLWLDRMGALLPDLMVAPAVTGIGDLHVENFGTWRDDAGIRRWGVNDFDDAGRGSYALDLVRLATSAALAPHLAISDRAVCEVLLDEWLTETPTSAADLSEPSAHHLRRLLPKASSPVEFYARLANGHEVPATDIPADVRDTVAETVPPGWSPTWHIRSAGTGSLGHPRFAAVGKDALGITRAREIKLLGPPTTSWLAITAGSPRGLPVEDASIFTRAMAALPGPAGAGRLDGWQYRPLSPDNVRIELAHLNREEAERLLRSMADAVAAVHGLDAAALRAARADAVRRPERWLRHSVKTMADDCRGSFKAFRARL